MAFMFATQFHALKAIYIYWNGGTTSACVYSVLRLFIGFASAAFIVW